LSKDDAVVKINQEKSIAAGHTATVTIPGEHRIDVTSSGAETFSIQMNWSEIEVRYDSVAAADAAYLIGRSGAVWERIQSLAGLLFTQKNIELLIVFDNRSFEELLAPAQQTVFIEAQEPQATLGSATLAAALTITAGKTGQELDLEMATELLQSEFDRLVGRDLSADNPQALTLNLAPAIEKTGLELTEAQLLTARDEAARFVDQKIIVEVPTDKNNLNTPHHQAYSTSI